MDLLIDDFIACKGYRPATEEGYRSYLGYAIDAGLDLETLRPAQLKAYFDEHPQWSRNHKRNFLIPIRSFCRFTYGDDHPILRMSIPKYKRKIPNHLSKDDYLKLIRSINTKTIIGARNLALVMVACDTSLRNRELCALTWDEVYLDERKIMREVKRGEYKIKRFSELAASILGAWKIEQRGYTKLGVDQVFTSIGGTRPGTAITKEGMRDIFYAMRDKAGLSKLHPHMTRHTHATLAIERGCPTRVLQQHMGLSRLEDLEIYTQGVTEEQIVDYFPSNYLTEEGDTIERSY